MKRPPALLWFLLLLALALPLAASSPSDLLSNGRADEAVASLKARINTSPGDAEAYNLLARTNFYLERWDDAVSAAEQSVRLAPNNSDYHMWLGRIYGEKADHSSFLTAAGLAGKVRAEFEKAVALDPANTRARADLAEFYMSAPGFIGGGTDKALAQADQLLALQAPSGLWVKASIAEKNKRNSDAERLFRQAVDFSHGNGQEWLNLASFYQRHGQLAQMEQAVNNAVAAGARSSNGAVLVDAAALLFRAGRNFDGAIQYLHQYLNSDIKVEEAPAYRAHLLLGNILASKGDRAGAAREYRAALALAANYRPARQALARLGAK